MAGCRYPVSRETVKACFSLVHNLCMTLWIVDFALK